MSPDAWAIEVDGQLHPTCAKRAAVRWFITFKHSLELIRSARRVEWTGGTVTAGHAGTVITRCPRELSTRRHAGALWTSGRRAAWISVAAYGSWPAI
jgi:hypothetical protein